MIHFPNLPTKSLNDLHLVLPNNELLRFGNRIPSPFPAPLTPQRFDLNRFPCADVDSPPSSTLSSENMPDDHTFLTLAPPRPLPTQGNDAPRRIRGRRSGQEPKMPKCREVSNRWTEEEDKKLREIVTNVGEQWSRIGKMMRNRVGKQCRERWNNHLRPDIKKTAKWTNEEEDIIVEILKKEGTKWSKISKILRGRTENSLKNHWNSTKRKIISNGIFLESSPLQRYIGLRSGATPWRPPVVRVHKDLSNKSGVGPSSRADQGLISGDQPLEEAHKEEIVLIDFFG